MTIRIQLIFIYWTVSVLHHQLYNTAPLKLLFFFKVSNAVKQKCFSHFILSFIIQSYHGSSSNVTKPFFFFFLIHMHFQAFQYEQLKCIAIFNY